MKKYAYFLFIVSIITGCAGTRIKKADKYNNRGAKALDAYKSGSRRNEQKLNEAMNYFTKSIEYDPNGKYAYINRGTCYRYLKKNNLAITDFNKAVSLYPDDALAYHNRAIAKQDSGLLQEALKDYLTAKDLDRKDYNVYYNLGTLHYRMDDYPTALEYYEKATEYKEDFALSYFAMGQLNRMMSDYDAALKNLSKTLELEPDNTMGYEERGLVYLKKKKYDLSLADLNKAIELSSDSYNAFFYRGLVKRALNKKDEMQSDFLKAGELKPYTGTSLYSIGRLLSENKDYADAITYYDQSLQLEKNLSTYNSLGYCHLMLKNGEAAARYYTEALKFDSLDYNTLNSRGMAYINLMKYDSAIADFKKCNQLQPAYLYPYNNMANCYFKLNQTDKACELWKFALSRGYVYNPEWKAEFDLEDPKELVKQHCK